MVRYKKRYFVVQVDRHSDILASAESSTSQTPKSKKQKLAINRIRRALVDPIPLSFSDIQLANAVKDIVTRIHGDYGRSLVTIGLRTIYCNAKTRLLLLSCRHGPHRLVASSLPFLNRIGNEDRLILRLIYTGATIRNCYKKMEKYQKNQLSIALTELGHDDAEQKSMLEKQLLNIRVLDY